MRSQKPLLFDDTLSFELLPEKQVKGLYLPIRNIYNFLWAQFNNQNGTENHRLFTCKIW